MCKFASRSAPSIWRRRPSKAIRAPITGTRSASLGTGPAVSRKRWLHCKRDQTVVENAGAQSVPGWATAISAGPANESGQNLTFLVTNDSNALFAEQPAISPSGSLSYTPADDATGTVTVTVQLMDNGGVANGGVDTSPAQTFLIVIGGGSPFVANPITDLTVNEDAAAQLNHADLNAVFEDSDNLDTELVYTISVNTGSGLVTAVIEANDTLDLSFVTDQNEVAQITLRATDPGDLFIEDTFAVTVNPVNDAQSFTEGSDEAVLEDAGSRSVPNWATAIRSGPGNESSQGVSFLVTNDNNALFSLQPAISATGTLSYAPAANAHGSATVTVQLEDDGGLSNGGVDTSASATFVITVSSVNDAPSFIKGPDQVVPEDAGAQSVPGWATAISAGPANESTQNVTFLVTNNNNALFAVQPAVSAIGTLSYTPGSNARGSATVTVQLADNGGSSNGGMDASTTETFTISVGGSSPRVTNSISDLVVNVAAKFPETPRERSPVTVKFPILGAVICPAPIAAAVNLLIGLATFTIAPEPIT